jgi:hypothetical protein
MRPSLAPVTALAFGTALFALPATGVAADLKLEEFFKGTTHAYGNFKAINGKKREFRVLLNGKWNGKTLVLREDFFYTDGERDVKTWRFTKTSPTTYSGTREDVRGTTTVKVKGNTAKFSYTVDIDNGPKTNLVKFKDTLILKKDGTLRNTARVSKFGIPVARVAVNFARSKAGAAAIKPR